MCGKAHREARSPGAWAHDRAAPPRSPARTLLAAVFLVLALLASGCAEARVHYTFEEDGSYRVEGTVALTQRDGPAGERLLVLRRQLERVGLSTADLDDPDRVGFAFEGDSANDTWARQQAGGGPRLWTDQGLLSRKSVLYWPFDWDIYLEGVAPERIDELEAAFFQTSDIQVTATFPGDGARHNVEMGGRVEPGSGGRTVAWTVTPLEPGFIRAEYTMWVWWRVALVPGFVLAAAALLAAHLYRSARSLQREQAASEPPPPVEEGPVEQSPEVGRVVLLDATASCPVCDAPVVPGEVCRRCVATAEEAVGPSPGRTAPS